MSGSVQIAGPRVAGWVGEAGHALRAHTGLAALIFGYLVIALSVATTYGKGSEVSLWLYGSLFGSSTILIGGAFVVARATYIMCVVRPDQLTKAIAADLRQNYLTRRRLLNALPVIVLLSIFNSAFTSMKALIPVLHPYNWDATLASWDTSVHFGVPPWQWLQPVLGNSLATGVINVFYNLWFFILAACWFWQAFSERDPRLRMQFLTTFVLCFALLGNLAATLLASGGPCFYGDLVMGADPYAPLMQYLHRASEQVPFVWSTAVQDMLWHSYQSGGLGIGSGISAMPSMHLAGATLFALLGWRASRWLGVVLTAYAAIILAGSVHLAWHYALDGYCAILGTLAIWLLVGWFIDRYATASLAQGLRCS